MPDYDNTNTGVLFKNDKQGNDKRPDYTGNINVDGEDKRLAAWLVKSKDGQKTFMSLRVSEIQQSNNAQAATAKTQTKEDTVHDVDDNAINLDNIPF